MTNIEFRNHKNVLIFLDELNSFAKKNNVDWVTKELDKVIRGVFPTTSDHIEALLNALDVVSKIDATQSVFPPFLSHKIPAAIDRLKLLLRTGK